MIELKTLRKSTHMTQEELAEVLKVPVSTYSKWEQGINRPADSQVYLMCYYLYNEGFIKTYLNDPDLTLTEMGLIMTWLRYDSYHRFIGNRKKEVCDWFLQFVSKEEADQTYKKLNKHYIMSRRISRLENNKSEMTERELSETIDRVIDGNGIEILPYDGGAIRGSSFDADEYYFFSRLSNVLGFGENRIKNILLDDCHDNFFTQNDISVKGMAVMNCLYYKYNYQFPLCFGVEDLMRNYGEDFFASIDELERNGYALNCSEYYEFYPDHVSNKERVRFYVPARAFSKDI